MEEIKTLDEWSERWVEVWQAYFIFKHSTACPTSAAALSRVNAYIKEAEDDVPEFLIVNVIESAPLSERIGLEIGVEHESPQLILVMGSAGAWSVSHEDITAENIDDALDEFVFE